MTDTKDDGTTEGLGPRLVVTQWRGAERRFLVVVVDSRGHELAIDAAGAFVRMRDHATRDGIALHINTALRTREHQERLYNAWLAYHAYQQRLERWREMGKPGAGPTRVDYAAKAAPPGLSTHEVGCSVDLQRSDGDDPATPEPDSPVDLWLKAHASEYGFARDVASEAWHYTHKDSVPV